jgi:hypothetical protein
MTVVSNAITFRAAFAIPGDLTRPSQSTVEAQPYGATAFPSYGVPVGLVSGLVVPIAASGTALYGFLVRPYPIEGANASDALGTAVPITSGIANVLKRGYIGVYVQNFAVNPAAANTPVYVWYAASTGQHVQGGVEAAATGGSTTEFNTFPYNAYFTCASDANGYAEIAFNL